MTARKNRLCRNCGQRFIHLESCPNSKPRQPRLRKAKQKRLPPRPDKPLEELVKDLIAAAFAYRDADWSDQGGFKEIAALDEAVDAYREKLKSEKPRGESTKGTE